VDTPSPRSSKDGQEEVAGSSPVGGLDLEGDDGEMEEESDMSASTLMLGTSPPAKPGKNNLPEKRSLVEARSRVAVSGCGQ
jgi:hypothetical protein